MEKVTSTLESLVDGRQLQDSGGKTFEKSSVGLTVEIFVDDVYFRGPPDPCNDGMGFILELMRPKKKETSAG